MSETLNVNVIVAAKEEYTKQLITILLPEMYDIIRNIFTNSQKNNLRRKISYSNFQKELKNVPRWSNYTLDEYLRKINQNYPYLMDLITAIFVSHVKILACVRIKADDKSIKIKVPNLNNFLHKIIINLSEQIYYYPDNIHDKERILGIITTSITDAISNQVPIEYILNEYLSGAFDEDVPIPETNNIIPDNSFNYEDDLESNVPEDDFKRDIPIGEITKLRPQMGIVNNDNENENENDNENNNDNDDDNDIENDNENIRINNSHSIEDSSDEDEEDEEDENQDDKKTIQTPALF
tara:strand:+ start:5032 stop:5916 length:885 start_codon:yes stop_codon:yes gene_type:complete